MTEEQTAIKTQALLATVSLENGVDHYALYERSVKNQDFGNFLISLRQKYLNEEIALFMDNMRVHHSLLSKEAYQELKLIPIFNIAYSPQFNPIESVFSMIKQAYKKLLLQAIIEKQRIRSRHLIANAMLAWR